MKEEERIALLRRLRNEESLLEKKIAKLEENISEKRMYINRRFRRLMRKQLKHMKAYSNILTDRIEKLNDMKGKK